MHIKKVLVAAIVALVLAASYPANAQQQSGQIAGMSPAMAAAAGIGLVVAGVLIANEIGSSGSGPLFPPDDDDDNDVPPDTPPTTPTTPTTPGT
ncbi:MAG: hypothetical protein JJT88_17845 [Gammaproteobacteria bacterium]|nr:hypothetical protein [Gammaproteobacteria bacterium]